ncbi:hypothetical protein ABIA06_002737 [Bradyrhizobium yuanmingense]
MARSNAEYSASDSPVEPGAVLLVGRFRGEARGALRLVGEIGMRPDQRQLHVRLGTLDRGHQRGVQLVDAGERPLCRELLGDPRRIFDDVGERRDEVGRACSVEIGE